MATKVPTATNIQKAKTAFEGMDYQKQQDFMAKNKDFDVNKLGFKLQTAPVVAPVDNKLLPNQTTKDKFVDTSVLEQQNNTGALSSTTQQNNTSNIPKNNINASQKNNVISTTTETKTDKITPTKDTGPSKEDISQQRLTEIQTNLQNYASNPDFQQYFKTQDAFNNYFGREQRTPEQQKVLDSFYTGYKVEQDKKAANNARYLTLSTMSDTDLQNINDINDISLISLDPNLKVRYDAAQKNKQIMEFVYGKDYNKTDTTPDGLDNIAGNYSQEYSSATSELTTTKNEMDKIQDTMDSTYDKLVTQYEGTGETDAYIRAKAGKINSELTNEYNDLARKYNSQLGTVTALQATETAKKEEQANNIQLANQKMQMYNFLYGTPSAQKEQVEIQTKDFGTAKSPNWKQSLDGGKTRQSISGISGGSMTGGGTGTGVSNGKKLIGDPSTDIVEGAIQDLENATREDRKGASLGGVAGFVSGKVSQVQSAYDYIINNLALKTYTDIKKQGATFGAMTEGEWKLIQGASARLRYGLNNEDWATQMSIIRTQLNRAKDRAGVVSSGGTTNQQGNTPLPVASVIKIVPDNNILAKDSKLTPQSTKSNVFQKIGETKTVKFIKNLFK